MSNAATASKTCSHVYVDVQTIVVKVAIVDLTTGADVAIDQMASTYAEIGTGLVVSAPSPTTDPPRSHAICQVVFQLARSASLESLVAVAIVGRLAIVGETTTVENVRPRPSSITAMPRSLTSR